MMSLPPQIEILKRRSMLASGALVRAHAFHSAQTDAAREERIAALVVRIETAYAAGHRERARRLFDCMRAEHAKRSACQIARLELARGFRDA